ncbi:uncharacterized protein MYCGRDRAFT_94428 [Zymoseptoria tritici IPO323]|uniref:Uncharacterized protein n=1 Tax=Zymoseptoria tritici (strain CBS 115943 / IPO323) TaxID=336722 RepID=F9XFN1_ZYMTI|nr:uncharacterized protein MYCGRDRAFT_94428 [Zymoseptoria tritici IPO323]EGP85655.1 hypothetical protein MYCGRDRAFT_94428 [Zymoseptoria tritici IPO323]
MPTSINPGKVIVTRSDRKTIEQWYGTSTQTAWRAVISRSASYQPTSDRVGYMIQFKSTIGECLRPVQPPFPSLDVTGNSIDHSNYVRPWQRSHLLLCKTSPGGTSRCQYPGLPGCNAVVSTVSQHLQLAASTSDVFTIGQHNLCLWQNEKLASGQGGKKAEARVLHSAYGFHTYSTGSSVHLPKTMVANYPIEKELDLRRIRNCLGHLCKTRICLPRAFTRPLHFGP